MDNFWAFLLPESNCWQAASYFWVAWWVGKPLKQFQSFKNDMWLCYRASWKWHSSALITLSTLLLTLISCHKSQRITVDQAKYLQIAMTKTLTGIKTAKFPPIYVSWFLEVLEMCLKVTLVKLFITNTIDLWRILKSSNLDQETCL